MNVIGLDGKEYKWNFSKYYFRKKRENKSNLHKEARLLIGSIFKHHSVYEEVSLPGTDLYADFWIPSLKTLIEVHGEQHYIHIPFFHKTKADFLKAQHRDRLKREWCELNSITWIVLPYDLKEAWESLLTGKYEENEDVIEW